MSLEDEIKKAEKIKPAEKPDYTPLYKIQTPGAQSTGHVRLDTIIKARIAPPPPPSLENPLYARGKTVIHTPTRAPVTILKCEGQGKAGVMEYIVVSRKGKKWTAKESDLRPKLPRT